MVNPDKFRIPAAARFALEWVCPVVSQELRSNVSNKIAQANLQRLGNFHQSVKGGVPNATLDVTDENSAEVSLFGKAFLAQSSFFSVGANSFSKESAMLLDWHSLLPNQEARDGTIKHVLSFLLPSHAGGVETNPLDGEMVPLKSASNAVE